MNIVLIGNGKWGNNYVKTINSSFPKINCIIANRNNWKELASIANGVIVATPPQSHIEIAKYILEKKIPVMIEKPLSLSLKEIESLENFESPILVNYIHLFSQAYQNLKNIITNKNINKIVSLGFNKGPIRDYSSLWDYGCHDLSMILDLLQEIPLNVNIKENKDGDASLFLIEMNFKNCQTQSLVGNAGKKSIRKLKIEYDGLKLIYDDKSRPATHSPPLNNAIQVFIDAIDGKLDNRLGLDLSKKITKILEDCQNSLNPLS